MRLQSAELQKIVVECIFVPMCSQPYPSNKVRETLTEMVHRVLSSKCVIVISKNAKIIH